MPALAYLLRLLRRSLSSGAALALVVIIGVASVASGKTYAWCVPMDQVPHGCCPEDADRHPDPRALAAEPTSVRPVCCMWRSMGELPSASARGEGAKILAAALVAIAALPSPLEPAEAFELRSGERAEASEGARYGPTRASPRSARSRRAALQVFHC